MCCSVTRRCSRSMRKLSCPGKSSNPSWTTGLRCPINPSRTRPAAGGRPAHTKCWPAMASPGGGRDNGGLIMILTLTDTNSAKISSALLKARRSAGSPAMGMVLTLIVVCDESEYEPAMKASMEAGREHPSRILLVVSGQGRTAMLDAEVRIGEGTPGEVVIIRMRGAIAAHPASVIRPLLLPDSPVVVWWPGKCPTNLAEDELAHLARRRLTDSSTAARPLAGLQTRAENYMPGDTDLSWTRLTPWRALLAAALDQYPSRITSVLVEAERNNPSADLLAAWLHNRLNLEVVRRVSHGPGITAVRLGTAAGDIAITRPDG